MFEKLRFFEHHTKNRNFSKDIRKIVIFRRVYGFSQIFESVDPTVFSDFSPLHNKKLGRAVLRRARAARAHTTLHAVCSCVRAAAAARSYNIGAHHAWPAGACTRAA